MNKAIVKAIRLGFLFSLFVSFQNHGFDRGYKAAARTFYQNADSVVVGKFDAHSDEDSLRLQIDEQVFYSSRFSISTVLKGDGVKSKTVINVLLPQEFRFLSNLATLSEARQEKLRLTACKMEMVGDLQRHPSDKTVCEGSVAEINQLLSKDDLQQKAILGYYVEMGRLSSLNNGDAYILFLNSSLNEKHILKQPSHISMVGNQSLETLKTILGVLD